MFGLTPQPTPFDLHWRMFGIDVRVHPFFWLMSVMLGWGLFERGGFPLLFLWVVCVFVSVLLHELGHVGMGRVFGSQGNILLYSFGGLAMGASNVRTRWERILVLFAGPVAQFVLLGIVVAVRADILVALVKGDPYRHYSMLEMVLRFLVQINLFWPLLNLLPIFPLDGGQISREVFEGTMGQRGIVLSLALSLAVAVFLAVQSLLASYNILLIPFLWFLGDLFMALFFALFAVTSFQLLQAEMNRGRWRDNERLPWE